MIIIIIIIFQYFLIIIIIINKLGPFQRIIKTIKHKGDSDTNN